jgi:HAD superfamily hydrolase (TIGR01549 family)
VSRPDWDAVTLLQATALAPHCHRLGFGHLDLDDVVRHFWAAFAVLYPEPDLHPDLPLEERRWTDGPHALRNILAEFGVVCPDDEAVGLWEALNSMPWRARHLHLYEDAVSTLQALRAAGYRLGVATARALSAAVVAQELREQGMPEIFEVIATSGEVGYRKPHPLVFASAARQLGVQAERALVVGDSYESDIVPAASLGMIPVLKLNERAPNPRWVLTHEQIPSLAALLELDLLRRR